MLLFRIDDDAKSHRKFTAGWSSHMEKVEIIDTTIGELIEALSEEASKIFPNQKDRSKAVALALGHLFDAANLRPKSSGYWN